MIQVGYVCIHSHCCQRCHNRLETWMLICSAIHRNGRRRLCRSRSLSNTSGSGLTKAEMVDIDRDLGKESVTSRHC